MLIKFEQPIGAVADVNELEYISALHQSDKTDIRRDGSIRGKLLMLCFDASLTLQPRGQPKTSEAFLQVGTVLSLPTNKCKRQFCMGWVAAVVNKK